MYTPLPRAFSEYERQLALKLCESLNLAPGPGGSIMADFKETALLFQQEPFVGMFPRGIWTKCSVVALYPSAQIPLHVDAPQDAQGTRYHVPLQTSRDAWVYSDGLWQQLNLGRVYKMDPTRPHGAVNWGTEIRLHFMVDIL